MAESLGRRRIRCFVVNFLEFFPDLAQTHRCVGENLIFRNLFLDDLCEDDLEGQREARLVNVLFEHESLVLTLANLVLVVVSIAASGHEGPPILVFVDLVHYSSCFKLLKSN